MAKELIFMPGLTTGEVDLLDEHTKFFRMSAPWLIENGFKPTFFEPNWHLQGESLEHRLDRFTTTVADMYWVNKKQAKQSPIYILALSASVSLGLIGYQQLNGSNLQRNLDIDINPIAGFVGLCGRVDTTRGFNLKRDELTVIDVYFDSVDTFEKEYSDRLTSADLRRIATWGSVGDGIAPDETTILQGATHFTIEGTHIDAITYALTNISERKRIIGFLESR